jgi:Mn2+/Fe2+ NRAMP family transporter
MRGFALDSRVFTVKGEPMPKHLSLSTLGPGLLVAATGVGAGDLITASLAGSEAGPIVAAAAVAGAVLKWTLNEGIARWQMATETTLLEGWILRLHPIVQWTFLTYFLFWSFVVGGALVNACGVAGTSLVQVGSPTTSKIVWGAVHSIAALLIVLRGGFKWFESAMACCVGVMVAGVILTAGLLLLSPAPELAPVAVRASGSAASRWALAVLGGVGGTVTLLSYGYWIAGRGRRGAEGLQECRIDLAVGYAMTALFGVSMIVIGSRVSISGQGAGVALDIANRIGSLLGPAGKSVFLLGFWGAVFSSVLGVWQSAPYLFADFVALRTSSVRSTPSPQTCDDRPAYRGFLVALAVVSLVWLLAPVRTIQLIYATLGAGFLPLLAVTLLFMNNRRSWVGELRNGWAVNALLVATLLLFSYLGITGIND